jgi:hypothetical protein
VEQTMPNILGLEQHRLGRLREGPFSAFQAIKPP